MSDSYQFAVNRKDEQLSKFLEYNAKRKKSIVDDANDKFNRGILDAVGREEYIKTGVMPTTKIVKNPETGLMETKDEVVGERYTPSKFPSPIGPAETTQEPITIRGERTGFFPPEVFKEYQRPLEQSPVLFEGGMAPEQRTPIIEKRPVTEPIRAMTGTYYKKNPKTGELEDTGIATGTNKNAIWKDKTTIEHIGGAGRGGQEPTAITDRQFKIEYQKQLQKINAFNSQNAKMIEKGYMKPASIDPSIQTEYEAVMEREAERQRKAGFPPNKKEKKDRPPLDSIFK